jgi:hypothetical protein
MTNITVSQWKRRVGTSYTTIFCISLSTSQAELVYVAA